MGKNAENTFERHVVLVSPDVPWNTGNAGRTCVGAGASLHVIEPIGFSLDHKDTKRAGLDYWEKVDLKVWKDFDSFIDEMNVADDEVALFSKRGKKTFWDMPSESKRLFLVFGSEIRGLPVDIENRYSGSIYSIPINDEIRSLNLSTSVGIALYESIRPFRPANAW